MLLFVCMCRSENKYIFRVLLLLEGFVTCDSTKLSPGESLYVALVGRFRYGREEDEVLGMSLCR